MRCNVKKAPPRMAVSVIRLPDFERHDVRITDLDGNPRFVLADVYRVLGRRHVFRERYMAVPTWQMGPFATRRPQAGYQRRPIGCFAPNLGTRAPWSSAQRHLPIVAGTGRASCGGVGGR